MTNVASQTSRAHCLSSSSLVEIVTRSPDARRTLSVALLSLPLISVMRGLLSSADAKAISKRRVTEFACSAGGCRTTTEATNTKTAQTLGPLRIIRYMAPDAKVTPFGFRATRDSSFATGAGIDWPKPLLSQLFLLGGVAILVFGDEC